MNKSSYPKPLTSKRAWHPSSKTNAPPASGGWMAILVVGLGFAAMLMLALGSGAA